MYELEVFCRTRIRSEISEHFLTEITRQALTYDSQITESNRNERVFEFTIIEQRLRKLILNGDIS